MRNRLIKGSIATLVAAGAVLGLAASPVPAGATGHHNIAAHIVRLNGQNEVPAADPDGKALMAYVAFGNHFCYAWAAKNIDPPLAAHIHTGAAGVNGGIVVMLMVPDPAAKECITAVPDGSVENTISVLTQGELDAIIDNPAGFYANVHTAPFPAGAIRGQLARS
jgi:hypothetical protein